VQLAWSSEWLLPALYASLAILLITVLQWPIAAIARRTYKAPHPLTGQALRTGRATRIAAGLSFALLIGWAVTIVSGMGSPDALAGGLDPVFWALQIAGVILFFGLPVIAGWNAWLTWRDGRNWVRKIWSVLIVLAGVLVLYFAIAFHLVGMTVNF